MAASSTTASLVKKINQAGATVKKAQRATVTEAVNDAKASILRNTPTHHLARVNARAGRTGGAKLGASTNVKGSDKPTAILKATGPWQILDHDAKAHTIVSARVRGAKAKAAKGGALLAAFGLDATELGASVASAQRGRGGVNIAGVGWRRYAHHPGHKGKGTWKRAEPAAMDAATRRLTGRTTDLVKQAFAR